MLTRSVPPSGFSFEIDSSDAPLQDDPRLEGVNIDDRVDAFVARCEEIAKNYLTVCIITLLVLEHY